ncbi:MAG TPA: YCF48-related protein [Rhodocyclaceae bacterium]|nr:YCF48-related protein [Rhodocyclaceae bacterium]
MFPGQVRFRLLATVLGLWSALAWGQVPGAPAPLQAQPAVRSPAAFSGPILGAAAAGKRIVAVGDQGSILLSDDQGRTFRQAARVPVSSTLTAVSFADDRHGWAVGHWGAILATEDGGETWALQRLDTHEDRPLFSVHFFDAREGVAVGLWSLVLLTRDGGKTWTPTELPPPPEGGKADRNLFKAFASPKGSLFVAAERGSVLRSDDRGHTWRYLDTGYKGSFWSGIGLDDGTLLVAGLRGTVYRSTDDGHSWQPVASGVKSSLTDLARVGAAVVGVGLDGVLIKSADHGLSYTWTQRDDRLSLTAAAPAGERLVLFSKRGVVNDGPDPLANGK